MKEEFLQFIWKYKLYNKTGLQSTNNDGIEVLNEGSQNLDSGPDFFNAKIKIKDTVWAGNVEIHINSSDWYTHKHHQDKAYDNVILQVVYNHDREVFRTNGQLIPTLELRFDQNLLSNYDSLLSEETWIPCQEEVNRVDSFTMANWLEKLTIERLQEKSIKINEQLDQTNNSWEESFYIQVARNFGFKLNADPFEQLAKSLPLKTLAKHKNNLFQIEALLYGQAGFLMEESGDAYYLRLKKEYIYLKRKFDLKPIEKHTWKFLRSRPGNFPTIRIAQFSSLIHNSTALFSKVMDTSTMKEFFNLFKLKPSEYWETHYQFNKESVKKEKPIGKSAIDILLINTIIPFLFVYGKSKGLPKLQEKAIQLLEEIKPEKNTIISKWDELGLKASNAFETQALIQLKNKYCSHKKCLNCRIGNLIIRSIDET